LQVVVEGVEVNQGFKGAGHTVILPASQARRRAITGHRCGDRPFSRQGILLNTLDFTFARA
jgi:hypothetical protein